MNNSADLFSHYTRGKIKMATRGKSTEKGFIVTENIDIDVSIINKSIRKVLSAIHSILTLGWIPHNEEVDPEKFDVDAAKEAQLAKMNNIATSAAIYSRRF